MSACKHRRMLRAAPVLAALTLLAGCAASHGSARPATSGAGPRTVRDAETHTIAFESTTPPHPDGLIVTAHGHNAPALHQYRSCQPYATSYHLGLVSVEWQTS